MTQTIIQPIVRAISTSLSNEFNQFEKKYNIYTEDVPQGFQEPCFFISCLHSSNKLFLGNRYFRENLFCIQYFPKEKNRAKEECSQITDRLFFCLEWLSVEGDWIRGVNINYDIEETVLYFFVNYGLFLRKQTEPITKMGHLTKNITAKGEREQ